MSDKLAIDGGTPVHTTGWPSWPMWDERERNQLLEVLDSGEWNDREKGKIVEFEKQYAAYQHAKHAVAVTGGTAALELSLRALGIGWGDEVITTSYTFIATPASIFKVGAVPVPADLDPATMNLDPRDVERKVTPKTKAIMPVHIGGCPADMDGIMEVAKLHGLYVIEDACQAWGAEWRGTRVGAIGDLGAFSFQASKNINAGEGGAVVTNSEELADRVWALHNAGRMRGKSQHEQTYLGYNYRMTEFQAGVLLAQLERLPEHTRKREDNAAYLDAELARIPGITPRRRDPRVTQSALHLYMFNYDKAAFGGKSREDFLAALRAEGVPCSPGYAPLYMSPAYLRALGEQMGLSQPWEEHPTFPTVQPLPACEKACQETVWFMQWQLMADMATMRDVVEAVAKIQKAWG